MGTLHLGTLRSKRASPFLSTSLVSFFFFFVGSLLVLGGDRVSAETNSEKYPIPNIVLFGSEREKEANEHRVRCINTLGNEYRSLITPHLKGKNPVLIETVDHGNIGDSIIQVGEMKLLDELGFKVRYPCTSTNCSLELIGQQMREFSGPTVLLIHGGGNLGDVWKSSKWFRSHIFKWFPTNQIILLPQSIFYHDERNAYEEGAMFRRHKSNVTIFVRDYFSLDYGKKHFQGIPSILCPDAAFMVGPVDASKCKPRYDIVFISRRDMEKRQSLGSVTQVIRLLRSLNISAIETDWDDWYLLFPFRPQPENRLDWPSWRLQAGVDMLCLGKMVITDRLHATILSTLMGLPHVYIDNHSKKVSSFVQSNFRRHEDCKEDYLRGWKATSWTHAAKIAATMFGKKL